MRTNVTRLLWVAVFLHLCVATPRIAALSDSCPCRPTNECPNSSEDFEKDQVSMLPCESDRLTRCCSTISKPTESANVRGSSRKNEVVDLEIDSTEVLTSLEENSTVFDTSEESSTATLQPNVEESTGAPVSSSTKAEDVETTESDVNLTHKRLQHVLSKPRPLRVRILNRTATSPYPREQEGPKPNQNDLKKNDNLVKQEVTASPQKDQALIEQVTSFESYRTSPKKPLSFPPKSAKKLEEQKFARNVNSLITGKVFLNRDYHSSANSKFPSIPKRVIEKPSDAFERQTSLGSPLTLDGASVRAINENASSSSELDDDTSIRSLSEAEDAENIKRVARSHASELEEKPRDEKNLPSTGDANVSTKRDEKKEAPLAKGFKRPPRVLPIRNLRNGEQTSGRFANSRERARSLFDKSNEARKKQVSFIINRNDNRMKKFPSVNKNLTSAEKEDNKYDDLSKNETLLVVEEVTQLVDKNVTDSIEVS